MKKISDVAKFRTALKDAGFAAQRLRWSPATIFNDKRLHGTRRLKLWNGAYVVHAPHKQKVQLVHELQNQFGERLISVGSIRGSNWSHPHSVVVKLRD
jgi:hypothetical protein